MANSLVFPHDWQLRRTPRLVGIIAAHLVRQMVVVEAACDPKTGEAALVQNA